MSTHSQHSARSRSATKYNTPAAYITASTLLAAVLLLVPEGSSPHTLVCANQDCVSLALNAHTISAAIFMALTSLKVGDGDLLHDDHEETLRMNGAAVRGQRPD